MTLESLRCLFVGFSVSLLGRDYHGAGQGRAIAGAAWLGEHSELRSFLAIEAAWYSMSMQDSEFLGGPRPQSGVINAAALFVRTLLSLANGK